MTCASVCVCVLCVNLCVILLRSCEHCFKTQMPFCECIGWMHYSMHVRVCACVCVCVLVCVCTW